jgi:endonuclease YncB( thermonuclease family)
MTASAALIGVAQGSKMRPSLAQVARSTPICLVLLAGSLGARAECPIATPASGTVLNGPAEAIDGTTLRIRNISVALGGIYAPSLKTECFDQNGTRSHCGEPTLAALKAKLAATGNDVRCVLTDSLDPKSDRTYFGFCGKADSTASYCLQSDFGGELTTEGHALLWDFVLSGNETGAHERESAYAAGLGDRSIGLFRYTLAVPFAELLQRINQGRAGRDIVVVSIGDPRESCPPLDWAYSEVIEGRPRVIDGATFDFAGTTAVMDGIFVPPLDSKCEDEQGQVSNCGATARAALERKTNEAGGTVRCLAAAHGLNEGVHYSYCGTPMPGSSCIKRDFGVELVEEGTALGWDRNMEARARAFGGNTSQEDVVDQAGNLARARWVVGTDELLLNLIAWSTANAFSVPFLRRALEEDSESEGVPQ